MKIGRDIFDFLLKHCSEIESVFRPFQGELFFSLSYLSISIVLRDCKQYDDKLYINIDEVDFFQISQYEVDSVVIQKGIPLFLENGKDSVDYIDSLTYEMCEFIRKINSKFNNSISRNHIGPYLLDDSCCMCDDVWLYGFQLFVTEDLWNNPNFYRYILSIDNDAKHIEIPCFYNNDVRVDDSFEIKILNSNTKIRRLGYLKILIKMFEKTPQIPINRFLYVFEKYCQEYSCFLDKYKNRKGLISVTKTGNSAKPYVDLALNLGLLRKSLGYYELGKKGQVYKVLCSRINNFSFTPTRSQNGDNPFDLTDFEKVFFLELLLRNDFFYLYVILEESASSVENSYALLKDGFKSSLLNRIESIVVSAENINPRKVLSLKLIERRIQQWEKPEVYLEHILMPRLNWLYDTGIIDLNDDLSFSLTANGMNLFLNISIWNDMALHRIGSADTFIEHYYMRAMDTVYGNVCGQRWKIKDVIQTNLEVSFELFKTLAPNRVTFSSFADYTRYVAFFDYKTAVDTFDIQNSFAVGDFPAYIYKYQDIYKDGYIQKR